MTNFEKNTTKTSENKEALFETLLVILDEIDRVCKKNNIRYFAFAGTLLGAVRHGGFIPWDDDIDLAMLRKDYERFILCCEKDLSPGFSLQTTLNEDDFYKYQIRIRKDDTTCLTRDEALFARAGKKIHRNCGIFVSVFPLDTVPESKFIVRIQNLTAYIRNKLLRIFIYRDEKDLKTKIVKLYCSIVGYKNIYKRFVKSFAKYSQKTGSMIRYPVLYSFAPITSYFTEDFSDAIFLSFENRKIPCPIGYKRCLERPYGKEYMIPPPAEERGKHIHSQFIDTNKCYKEYTDLDSQTLLKIIENN